jgi:hypothetical protein
VRIPIPVVIFLVIAVVWGTWWSNTRHMDFLTPPSEAKLEEIRMRVRSTHPVTEDAVSAPVPPPKPTPPAEVGKPVFVLGDLKTPPTLAQYADRSKLGAAFLVEMATHLEEAGEFQRALLAWERVLDQTQPDPAQAATAISSIQRLKPTLPDWNSDPAAAIPITLYAGTGPALSKQLKPLLEQTAKELDRASAGILKFSTHVTTGKLRGTSKGPKPVALWIGGTNPKASSTEVLSFTVDAADSLLPEVLETLFILIRNQLARTARLTPPIQPEAGEDPLEALQFRITRLGWKELGMAFASAPNE